MPALHFFLVRPVSLPLHHAEEGQVTAAGWEWKQSEDERFEMNVQALRRCKAAGAKEEDVRMLARECGIDPKYITTNEPSAASLG